MNAPILFDAAVRNGWITGLLSERERLGQDHKCLAAQLGLCRARQAAVDFVHELEESRAALGGRHDAQPRKKPVDVELDVVKQRIKLIDGEDINQRDEKLLRQLFLISTKNP